jgi:hypothetical protein
VSPEIVPTTSLQALVHLSPADHLVYFREVPLPSRYDLAAELLLLRARCAYVLAYGSAWEQRVVRGELDHVALGGTNPPSPASPPSTARPACAQDPGSASP